MGDTGGGIFALIMALLILCNALYFIIKLLKKLVLSNDNNQLNTKYLKCITNNGYVSMLFGMFLTIAVQSSSITTSVFTPLVGLSIISLEQMFPLTLGANLGTTCTALFAAFVTESKDAVQVSICHLLFNGIGIILIYPVPKIRKVPLQIARYLGYLGAKYPWFGVFYILYVFVCLPFIFLAISFLFNTTIIGIVFGYILSVGTLGTSWLLFYKFDNIVHYWVVMQRNINHVQPITTRDIEFQLEPMQLT